jgi:hypothetical protein
MGTSPFYNRESFKIENLGNVSSLKVAPFQTIDWPSLLKYFKKNKRIEKKTDSN